jgi:hypothetical protein
MFGMMASPVTADMNQLPLEKRIVSFEQKLSALTLASDASGDVPSALVGDSIRLENCQQYPYHDNHDARQGYQRLAADLRQAVKQGLRCLSGNGKMGRLHEFHDYQARQLLSLLEDGRPKTFRCVADRSFAYAIAKVSPEYEPDDYLDKLTHDVNYPGIVLDTYRISGFLSTRHEPATYREFFKLDERLVQQQLDGRPQRLEGLHRYRNLPSLLFHEMVHWLGYEHVSRYPDIVDLYETCCFGGDDHVTDQRLNRQFQSRACAILRDPQLWEISESRQKDLWRSKGYDRLKSEIRAAYD